MKFLDYAPAPESQALLDLKSDYGLFINGESTWVIRRSGT